MYRKPFKGWIKHADFILLDIVCLHAGFLLAYGIRHGFYVPAYSLDTYRAIAIVLTLADLLVAAMFNTFSKVLRRGYFKEFVATLQHVLLVFAIVATYMFSTQTGDAYSRIVIYLNTLFHLLFGYIVRVVYKRFHKVSGSMARSMLVISTKAEAEAAVESVLKDKSGTIRIAGLAVADEDMTGQSIAGFPVVAGAENVAQYVIREWVDEVYVRLPQPYAGSGALFRDLRQTGITIHVDATDFEGMQGYDFMLEKIGGSYVLTSSIKVATGTQLLLKRVIDLFGGIVGSVFTLLIAAVLAPIIKKQSPGPLFFVQERIGLNGKHFKMYKFRSMYLDAEARKQDLMAQNRVSDGRMFKLDWDPRIIGNEIMPDGTRKTGIGEFIRRTSLDEFPQFFNVLKGDMSLVGTRPPTLDEWEKYELHHRARLSTKPGITGMWQVSGRSEIVDFEEITRLDTEYIANWNIGLDIKILLKTVGAVLNRKGAM